MDVEKWTLDDGRKAEKRIVEQKDEAGNSHRVIELHVEQERPLKLQQRVIEKTKPFIYERKIEIVDPVTGNVVEEKIETLSPSDVIEPAHTVSAQSSNLENDCDCNVTKQEIIDIVIAAMKAKAPAEKSEDFDFNTKIKSVGNNGNLKGLIADEIGKNKTSATSNSDNILIGFAIIAIGVLGYVLFFM